MHFDFRRSVSSWQVVSTGVLTTLAIGCDGEDWRPGKGSDVRALCVGSLDDALSGEDAGAFSIAAGSTLKLTALSDECLSGSCSRNTRGTCDVRVEGSDILVTSEFTWEEKGGTCTLDCLRTSAECESEPLSEGRYTLRLGGRTKEVLVPGELASSCLGSGL